MPARSQTFYTRPNVNSFLSLRILGLLAASLIGAAFLFRSSPSNAPESTPIWVGEYDAVTVPVPVDPVPVGTMVRNIRFRNESFPKHQIPKDSVVDIQQYLDAVTTAPLPAALPLFQQNLSFTALGSNPVIDRIPPGMRAMTVRVDATSSVEGWAASGSIVDVLLVTGDRTTVIAERVKILSAERSVAPIEGTSAPSVPSTVTLLVTQEQCLAIHTGIPLGKIAFVLRSTHDQDQWDRTHFSKEGLKGGRGSESREKRSINGYVSVGKGRTDQAFVLSDGKWIKSEVLPEGFFVSRSSGSLDKRVDKNEELSGPTEGL